MACAKLRGKLRIILVLSVAGLLVCFGALKATVLQQRFMPPPNPARVPASGLLQVFDYVSKKEWVYPITNLTTRKRDVQMYIFNPQEDGYVSLSILENGRWESATFDAFESMFQRYQDLHLLDIGCHIGNFALLAAAWGRKVVAVDSCLECVSRLRQSVDLNNFRDRITTFWNAVGDEYKNVSTKLVKRNYAAGYIVELGARNDQKDIQESVPMIHLNDLLVKTTFKRAIMKLDIEGYEPKALKYADKLFSVVDIPHVFMKWHILKKNKESAEAVIKFFRDRGYKPIEVALEGDPLGDDYKKWPTVYRWRKMYQ